MFNLINYNDIRKLCLTYTRHYNIRNCILAFLFLIAVFEMKIADISYNVVMRSGITFTKFLAQNTSYTR